MPKKGSSAVKKKPPDGSLSPQALAVLREKISLDGVAVRIDEQLSRQLYEEVHEVLVRLGGTYVSSARKHQFPYDPGPLLDNVLKQGQTPPKNPLEFFYSTPVVVEAIRTRLDPESNNNMRRLLYLKEEYGRPFRILEPSAGLGHLADMLRAFFPEAEIVCCEIDPYRRSVLEAKGYTVFPDFERYRPEAPFDLVVMNPPFGLGNEVDTYIRHIYRAMGMLSDEEESELFAIAPSGFTYNQQTVFYDFFTLVMEHGIVESLPVDAFKESGTITQTLLLWLGKRVLPGLRDLDERWWGYPNKRVGLLIEWIGWEYDYDRKLQAILERMVRGELPVYSNGKPAPVTREAFIRCCQEVVAQARRNFHHLPLLASDHDLLIDEIMKRFESDYDELLKGIQHAEQAHLRRRLSEAKSSVANTRRAIEGYREKIRELEQAIATGEHHLEELVATSLSLEAQVKDAPVFEPPPRPDPPPPATIFDLLLSA